MFCWCSEDTVIACFLSPPHIVLIIVSEKKLGLCFLILFSLSRGPPLSIIKAGLRWRWERVELKWEDQKHGQRAIQLSWVSVWLFRCDQRSTAIWRGLFLWVQGAPLGWAKPGSCRGPLWPLHCSQLHSCFPPGLQLALPSACAGATYTLETSLWMTARQQRLVASQSRSQATQSHLALGQLPALRHQGEENGVSLGWTVRLMQCTPALLLAGSSAPSSLADGNWHKLSLPATQGSPA